jgi:hypothetical protein
MQSKFLVSPEMLLLPLFEVLNERQCMLMKELHTHKCYAAQRLRPQFGIPIFSTLSLSPGLVFEFFYVCVCRL